MYNISGSMHSNLSTVPSVTSSSIGLGGGRGEEGEEESIRWLKLIRATRANGMCKYSTLCVFIVHVGGWLGM